MFIFRILELVSSLSIITKEKEWEDKRQRREEAAMQLQEFKDKKEE